MPWHSHLTSGFVVGIIGGGQLGRMMVTAASRLGYHTVVLSPECDAPAAQFAHKHIHCDYSDLRGLEELADYADAVTYELEQLPLDSVQWISERAYLAPGIKALDVSQDRIREKRFLNSNDVPTTAWRECSSVSDVAAALASFGRDSILKVAFGGYDGKGQARVSADISDAELAKTWEGLSHGRDMVAVLEAMVDFDCELSVVVARDKDGRTTAYDVVRNYHENQILHTTVVPAGVSPDIALRAQEMAIRIAEALDYIGVMCLELFLTADGELLANEIAPRPHNSGHWTLDACYTDQFEQHIRAVCGLPLGSSRRFVDATMRNILGTELDKVSEHIPNPKARLHLYGKDEWRPGRKMGHVTILEGAANEPSQYSSMTE